MELTQVLIGIQARSTSQRLPGKCFEYIAGKMLLEHVIDAAKSAAKYLNMSMSKYGVSVRVAVLTPFQDQIAKIFADHCLIIEGPEHDVLARYKIASDKLDCDYIVRVTGDCPMIPGPFISKHVTEAYFKKLDYANNCEPSMRTSIDGQDCEVMSRKLLDWADGHATSPEDREHVTTYIRSHTPAWARTGFVGLGYVDLSHIKLSVDTKEDLENVRAQFESIQRKERLAKSLCGEDYVIRF